MGSRRFSAGLIFGLVLATAAGATGQTTNGKYPQQDKFRQLEEVLPTPNLFAGGLLFHSHKEWIPTIALAKSTQVIMELCRLWAEDTTQVSGPQEAV